MNNTDLSIHSEVKKALLSRPTTMHVDLGAMKSNAQILKKLVAPAKLMAVIKANGYGHGLTETALALETAGVDSLAVAYVEEGIALRKAGVKAPILVLGGMLEGQIPKYLEHNLDIVGLSVSKLELVNQAAAQLKKKASVHLKIDTGMERLGQHYYTADKLFEKAIGCKSLNIAGVMSHFACADDEDLSFCRTQLERFHEALGFFEKRSLPTPVRHIANSAAAVRLPESRLDMVRPGILLFGASPFDPKLDKIGILNQLKPTMQIKSRIVYFKTVKAGAGVSYSHSFKATTDTRIVTIPIGYGDGYPRALSNRSSVLIRGKRYPVVGNICMDQLMVNLGPKGEGFNGDEVTLLGESGRESITVRDLAGWAQTIGHEILVSFNERIPRYYLK